MKPAPGCFEEHPVGSVSYRWRIRVEGRLVTIASGAGHSALDAREEIVPLGRVVYFIAAGDLVKIGMTDNLENRLRNLASSNGTELKVLATVHGGRGLERFLHACFADLHARGEWFHHCSALRLAIRTLAKYRARVAA